jgi:hypothetical protein
LQPQLRLPRRAAAFVCEWSSSEAPSAAITARAE